MQWQILALLCLGLLFLVIGGDLLVKGASKLALKLGVAPVVVGLTVVAFGTSAPELAVSLKAAFAGNADIAVANIVGSNIFNILFILGVSSLIAPLLIHAQIIKREVPIMIGASVLLYLMSLGGGIQRWEGVVLFAGIIAYTYYLIREARVSKIKNTEVQAGGDLGAAGNVEKSESLFSKILNPAILIGIGLLVVMLGADWLVRGAVSLAKGLGVSDTVVGLTIVAAGTSLPEVTASIMATIRGERDIAVGNVIGSNIYNILAIVGISGALAPKGLQVNQSMLAVDMPVMIFVAAVCWIFFRSGQSLSRLEGGLFLTSYIAYTVFLVVKA